MVLVIEIIAAPTQQGDQGLRCLALNQGRQDPWDRSHQKTASERSHVRPVSHQRTPREFARLVDPTKP